MTAPMEEFDHSRIAESFMNDILTFYPQALDTLGARNPNPEEFGDWLTTDGTHFAGQRKLLTVVIDGLDHVWRGKDSREELVRLFEHLLPAPAGVVIVVGTQPVDDDQLPLALQKGMIEESTGANGIIKQRCSSKMVRENELDLPTNNEAKLNVLDQLAIALHSKTDGHAVRIRFVLGYLLD